MIKKIIKSIKNPSKAFKYIFTLIQSFLMKKNGILLFLGMDTSGEFGLIFRKYQKCYGFEPNPDRYNKLYKKYKKYKNIHILNAAVSEQDGEVELNISSNNGASSSMGTFKKEWENMHSGKIKMIKTIRVPSVNLLNFCNKNEIEFIDDYISDIQGMDLIVLKTLKPMIDERRIGTIRCEVTKDGKENIYNDLPDNSLSGFKELLDTNYELIAKGKGILSDNKFEIIHDDEWEMDCKWQLKN